MTKETTSFLHNGSIGDVIASVPCINEHYKKTGKKAILYLVNGTKAVYYEGAMHPTLNEKNEMVMLNEKAIQTLAPLLMQQESIDDVKMWSNQPIHIDLNQIRETFVNMPYGCLSRWYFYVLPDLACDLSKQWLTAPDAEKDLALNKIIVTRTERYLNPQINYSFLKKFEDELLFVGTDLEHSIFCLRYNLKVKRLIVNDFLELAQAIRQSKFHLSNQTMAFQISQGLKHPRIVELCRHAPNVIPYGEDAYDFYAQGAVEYYFMELYKKAPIKGLKVNQG